MNSGADLMLDIQQKQHQLDAALRRLNQSGQALADAEREYKIELRKVTLQLRDNGMPVGTIDKVIYGVPSVADLRFKRDIAETVYRTNQEAINVYKLELRIMSAQIDREWSNPEGA